MTASREPTAATIREGNAVTADLFLRSLPFLGSAVVFFSIVFLTWAQTPRRLWDSLSFTLFWFLLPWACYAIWVGLGFSPLHWSPPDWVYTVTRVWIGLTLIVALFAVLPRVWQVIQFRRLHGLWPRDYPA